MDAMNIFCSEKSVKTELELNFPYFVYDSPLLITGSDIILNIHKPNYIRSSILISNIPQFTHWHSEWMIQLSKKI